VGVGSTGDTDGRPECPETPRRGSTGKVSAIFDRRIGRLDQRPEADLPDGRAVVHVAAGMPAVCSGAFEEAGLLPESVLM
jgi:hypothetical protein